MASGWTNRGKFRVLGHAFVATAVPTNYYVVLCTSAATPTVDQDTFSGLTQVSTGNGYTDGGISLTPGGTDFDTHTQDNVTNDDAYVQVKDVVWTASGGTLPASNSARWAVLTDDNITLNSRHVYAFFDLSSDRQVSDTQTLTLQDLELRIA